MSKNDSRTYSYYLDRFGCGLYEFDKKEKCMRNYIVYMLDRTQRMFEYKGLPDTIPARMLEFQLQVNGFTCIAEHNGELYAYWGGLGGEPDVYLRPTICVVSNAAQRFSKSFKIDEDCVIIRNDAFLYGMMPLFRRYATAMVENDLSSRMASINTRIQAWVTAPDDETKAAGDKFIEDIEDGKLSVIASNEFLDGLKTQPVQGSMRTFTDLIEYQQYLKASWFNEIGLNANYNMKREKLSTTESQMNNDALLPLVDDMLEQRRLGVEKVNEMFGTNITVDFCSSWEKLIEEFESNQLDSGGDINELDESQRSDVSGSSEMQGDNSGTEMLRKDAFLESDDETGVDGRNQRRDDSEGSSDVADSGRSGSESAKELGEPSEESESTQLDTGEVEVNVDVTVNVGSEVEEDEETENDSDRSVREDSSDDGSN